MQILKFPAFKDNYIWGIQHKNHLLVVDPGDSSPIIDFLSTNENILLNGILITHHHQDHVGGIEDLVNYHKRDKEKIIQINGNEYKSLLPVLGPKNCQKFGVNFCVEGCDNVKINEFTLSILDIPGHTEEHVGYFFDEETNFFSNPFFFCGDTLFGAGCGRVLGGSAQNLFKSLKKISKLPLNTSVFCAHEYTLANINFAHHLFPNDKKISKRKKIVEQKRTNGISTIPTTIEEELETNPFYRCKNLDEFIVMRKQKDLWI